MKRLLLGALVCSLSARAWAQVPSPLPDATSPNITPPNATPPTATPPTATTPDTVVVQVDPMVNPETAAPAGAFDWKLRLQAGQKWELRSFTRMTQSYDFPPEARAQSHSDIPAHLEVKLLQRMTMEYEVLSLDQFGAATIKITYRDVDMNTSQLRDGKPQPKGPEMPANFLKSLIGASFTIKQAPNGKIWAVSGLDALQQRIFNSIPGLNAQQKAQIQDLVSKFVSDKGLRESLNSLSGNLPPFPIRVGDSWDYDLTLPPDSPISFEAKGRRTLKARKNGVASVQDQVDISSARLDIKRPTGNASLSGFTGFITAATQVDESTGLPISATTTHKTSSVIEIAPPSDPKTPGAVPPPMIRPSFVLQSTTNMVMEPK